MKKEKTDYDLFKQLWNKQKEQNNSKDDDQLLDEFCEGFDYIKDNSKEVQRQNLFDRLNKLYEQAIKIDYHSDSIEDWAKLKQNYYKMQLLYESLTAVESYLIRSENKKTTETAIKQILHMNDRIRTLGEKLIQIKVKKQIADYCFSKK